MIAHLSCSTPLLLLPSMTPALLAQQPEHMQDLVHPLPSPHRAGGSVRGGEAPPGELAHSPTPHRGAEWLSQP